MPPKLSADGTTVFLVRMPTSMHSAIKASAKRNERTMAQEVRHAIRLYLSSEEANR